MRARALLACLLAFTAIEAQAASSVTTEHVRASLIAAEDAIVPGQALHVALKLKHQPGWHSYWKNPGDAGIPTTLHWQIPDEFQPSEIDWPPPERLLEGPLAVYAYSDEVILPVTISVPLSVAAEAVTVSARAEWLACSDICIPEKAELTLELPVAAAARETAEAQSITRPALPRVSLEFSERDKQLHLSFAAETFQEPPRALLFMPEQENVIAYASAQQLSNHDGRWQLSIERANGAIPAELSGFLRAELNDGSIEFFRASSALVQASPLVQETPLAEPATVFLPLLLLSSLLGGLILNLMPCVLPVLSLKALSVAKASEQSPRYARKLGLSYSAGVILSFVLIGGVLLALKGAGEQIGWGYQMQSPSFVGGLALLLLIIGLNLSGFFHLPVLLGSFGHRLTHTESSVASFLTGILAVAAATPCTAPFMASAVGAALTLPAAEAMLIFIGLGIGLALPFLLISFSPAALRFLPKPGAWMIRLKEALAFPIYLSAIWLFWVLDRQLGPPGLLIILLTGLALVFLLWLMKQYRLSMLRRLAYMLAFIGIIAIGLHALQTVPAPIDKAASPRFSQITLQQTLAAGQPVFVNATAAWCLTCQINKHTAILQADVQTRLHAGNILYLEADWTNRDPEITAFLAHYGYSGVPLYVYFAPGKPPKILPQLLTPATILAALNGE